MSFKNHTYKIDFYFDFLSPYSYLAWTWVKKNLENYQFCFYPVSMATVIAHYETKGPAQIIPKRNYLAKDLIRKTQEQNIEFKPPQKLPFNSLYALRLALLGTSGEFQVQMIETLFHLAWAEGKDIGSDDFLKASLKTKSWMQEDFIKKMESKEARIELKNNIERALAQGVFGVPTFIVWHNKTEEFEFFWGHDSIDYLELFLNGKDPLDKNKLDLFLSSF